MPIVFESIPADCTNFFQISKTRNDSENSLSYEIFEKESGKLVCSIPVQRGNPCEKINGVFSEILVLISQDIIEDYQKTEFACDLNVSVLEHLQGILNCLRQRIEQRKSEGKLYTKKP